MTRNLSQKFRDRKIKVQGTGERVKRYYNNKQYEFDTIVHNGDEIIVVEIKTTLQPQDVDHFIENLKVFKKVFPEYSSKRIYGAVAYMMITGDSDKHANNRRLFVIKATGDSAYITNPEDFKPWIF